MVKIKNVRPGILIIADAGLKLAPGESVELETLTRQAEMAVTDGLLARTDAASSAKPENRAAVKSTSKPDTKSESKPGEKTEAKPKDKTAASGADGKDGPKKGSGQTPEEQQAPEENPGAKPEDQPTETGQGQLLGTDNAAK